MRRRVAVSQRSGEGVSTLLDASRLKSGNYARQFLLGETPTALWASYGRR
ncbi:hypothetical protein [Nostoc sp.]